jgi:hypothetical protein
MNDYHIAAHKATNYFDIPRTLGSYECGWWLRGLPPMMYQHYAQSLAVEAAFEWNGNDIDDLVDIIYEKFDAARPDIVYTCEGAKHLHEEIALLQQEVVLLSDGVKIATAYINALQEVMEG